MAEEEQKKPDDFDDFARDAEDPSPRDDGEPGPPDRWEMPTWYSRADGDWWALIDGVWKRDPCPVRPLGSVEGQYVFITSFGEIRRFTSGQLHGRGGLADLFGGSGWWQARHFRKFNREDRVLTGSVQEKYCAGRLIRWCLEVGGYYDESRPAHSIGTWRDQDGRPIVHAGDRILHDGRVHDPGARIDDIVFVIGPRREAPAHVVNERGLVEWQPAPPAAGHIVGAHLDQWAWLNAESRDLFQGSLHCNMLGSWLSWLPHIFVEAPYGSGKTLLLRYARTVLGGASHDIQRNYTRAHFEQNFEGTAMCFPVDETENDSEPDRIRKIIEFVRLLSDDGATGGRGTSSGKGRRMDVHGAMLMAATMTEEWLPQDRSRISLLEILSFRDRKERPPAPPEEIAAMFKAAAEMSVALRARALATTELFSKNLRVAREAILRLGGLPRDADQLGHLIAGWRTMTSDIPFDPEIHEDFTRFRPFIVSLQQAEDGEDEPNELLNRLFGSAPSGLWKGGAHPTIGEMVARARDPETGGEWRAALPRYGLRLERRGNESFSEAWLLIAHQHEGLDDLFKGKPRYQGKKRATILKQLCTVDSRGVEWRAKPSEGESTRLRFAGQQSRYLMIPPVFLPDIEKD
jgi:hypothetical protein